MIPLAIATPGKVVKIVAIHGGIGIRKRLADLGLTPGTTLSVVQANSRGPIIISFKNDVRLALGRGMAYKIKVEPLAL